MNILFLCTGNTCRSPIAEAILKSKQLRNVEVHSAGLYAQDGMPMSAPAKAVLQEHGIEENHRSSSIHPQRLMEANLILTMTNAHLQALLQHYPQLADKAFTLTDYVTDRNGDISDPYGGSLAIYRHTFNEIQQLVDALQSKILED